MLRRGLRSDTVGRAVLAAFFYLTLTSSHVSAKKRLVQKQAFPTVSGRDLDRSPIYESNSHHSNYPQFNDDHHQDYVGQAFHGHSHEDLSSSAKYRYSDKKKTPQVFSLGPAGPSPTPFYKDRRPQLYTLEHLSSPRPTVFSNSKTYSGVSQSPGQYYSTPPTTPEFNQPVPDSKKYAFAYAVRPKDGYSGDDFSHKESRDGKVTMGEYKVLLPDGRLQVVRYTADGQTGFKADVTYEGEDAPNNDNSPLANPRSKPARSPYGEPTSAIHKQFAAPPPTQNSFPSGPYKPNPIFYSNPLTSHPSLSPSLVYKESRQDDHQYHDYHADQRFDNSLNPSPPSSAILYKVSPTPYSLKKLNPNPIYTSIKKVVGPTEAPFFKFKNPDPTPTPRSIYDKISASPYPSPKSPYSPVPYGHRAGPSLTYPSGPHYKHQPSPSPTSYDTSSAYSHSSQPQAPGRRRTRLLRLTPVEPTPIVAKVITKSKLVPVELFKAGPTVSTSKDFKVSPSSAPIQFDIHAHSHEHHDNQHDTHYFLQDEPHPQYLDHQNQNHAQEHHFIDDHQQHHGFPPVKSSLATFASSLDYHGNNVTPKPKLYIKSKSSNSLERRPSIGGLVYLETPGRGPRPNAIGAKGFLDRVPYDNLPRPRTTTHPYELGSKDYGNNVGYSPSSENFKNKKSFNPSQEIPPEYLPKLDTQAFKHHHSREYLVDGKQDTVLAYDSGAQGLTGHDQDQIVYSSYE